MTGDGYPVPARPHRAETLVRRSRFITSVARAPDEASAHAFIHSIREEFPDATHNCWAFVAGPPGDTARVGMSDDGEPHGTAGRPLLTALLHSGVGEVAAVVTRYYGGVKLGKGGLGRAYAGAVAAALAEVATARHVERVEGEIVAGYPQVDALLRLLRSMDVIRLEETWGARVRIRVAVPEAAWEQLEREVAELTAGAGRLTLSGGPAPEGS